MVRYTIDELKNSSGPRLYDQAKKYIPGGTQLLSKRPEMFAPDVWPSYYSKAKGCNIWDLDGRKFIDMSIMAVGAAVLGYADKDVDDAVIERIRNGSMTSLNCPEEVALAEALFDLHPWFDSIRYAKSGGEAMAIAIRIARASTKREKVLFSGYHGWSDWYLAANLASETNLDGELMSGLSPCGVPKSLSGTAEPFTAFSIEALKQRLTGPDRGEVAAIVIEPARGEDAPVGYLEELKIIAKENGAVLIFDEITTGFRMCPGGIHRRYNVHPDIAVFAKSMANGYPMSAVLGKSSIMDAAQTTFISSTNWTEGVGLAAALATIKKYVKLEVDRSIISSGERVKDIWRQGGESYRLPIRISGLPTLASFSFDVDDQRNRELHTAFSVKMLERGFLGFRQFKASLSHTDLELDLYQAAVADVFSELSSLPEGKLLSTPLQHNGFKRLTVE